MQHLLQLSMQQILTQFKNFKSKIFIISFSQISKEKYFTISLWLNECDYHVFKNLIFFFFFWGHIITLAVSLCIWIFFNIQMVYSCVFGMTFWLFIVWDPKLKVMDF